MYNLTTGIHPAAIAYLKNPKEFFQSFKIKNFSPVLEMMYVHFVPKLTQYKNKLNIYAGYQQGPDKVDFLNQDLNILANFITENYKDGTELIFENAHEGGSGRMFARLHDLVDITGIPASKFHYVVCLVNLTELYEKFCQQNDIKEKINLYGIMTFEYSSMSNLRYIDQPKIFNTNKERLFLCFNRVVRTHRTFLVSLLLKEKLVSNSYYSYFPNGAHVKREDPIDTNPWFIYNPHYFDDPNLFVEMQNSFNANLPNMPYKLNIEPDNNKVGVDSDDYLYFENSWFSLVTETFFFPINSYVSEKYHATDDDGAFFSEKIFKPVQMCHPFILVSSCHSLKYFRKLGYQTFHPYIDESYDDIENHGERMLAIVKEVKRLNSLTLEEKQEWLKAVLPIAVHNYLTLKGKTTADILVN